MELIKKGICLLVILLSVDTLFAQKEISISIENTSPVQTSKSFYSADDSLIQYVGRIQKTNPSLPRFWMPGVYIKAKFEGNAFSFFLNDEVLYGNVHNYLEIIIDNQPFRLQTKYANNKFIVNGLKNGEHAITICKDTESGNGYLEFAGIVCNKLLALPPKPTLKMEFIGNSITCGFGDDASQIPCGKGEWYDEHNAYMAYGPLTARALNAQWHISAVSGIGMIHSCCNMKILMPQVFDKINMSGDSIAWNFNEYIPDIVTICLGQNDGIQDSTTFCSTYVDFVKTVRSKYADAKIILLTSPMADVKLRTVLKSYLASIVEYFHKNGDSNLFHYGYQKSYNGGCMAHPDLKEQKEISDLLLGFIKEKFEL
jgi:carbohydrate esterase-like protein/GDSL-like lipase/acylhydrolase family protein